MTEPVPSESNGEDRRVIHDLRNAINAMVTSARCLALCSEIPEDFRAFVTAIESNGARACTLLDQLRGEAPP